MIPHVPPPNGGMGIVIPFPAAAPDSRPSATTDATRCRPEAFLGIAERCADFLAVMGGVLLAWQSYRWMHAGQPAGLSSAFVLRSAALFSLLFVLLLEKHGEYRPYLSLLAVRETERMLRVLGECFLVTVALSYAAATRLPFTLVISTFVALPLALGVEKSAVRMTIRWLRGRDYGMRRTVILGAGPLAKSIYSVLIRSPKLGLDPVAIVDEDAAYEGVEIHASSYRCKRTALVLAGPLSAKLFRNLGASVLVIADPDLDTGETLEVLSRANSLGVSAYVVSRDYLEPGYWLEYSELDGITLARMTTDTRHKAYEVAKRGLDLLGACILLMLLAPVFGVLACLVGLTSSGPAFFRQQRIGRQGHTFWMYKFRSMYEHSATYAFSPKTGDDSRITPIGRFLRRTCLDELPQLWNVVRGEMSLVGPRPEMPFIADRYTAFQRQRLAVKPGITGLWQLSGDRSYLIHENIEYDLYYIRNRNLAMDLAVLLHTLVFAARGV